MTYRIECDPLAISSAHQVSSQPLQLGETEIPTWPSGRRTFFASGQATNGVNYPLFADWNIFGSKRDEICSSLAVVSARDGFGGHGFAHSDPDAMD